MKASDHKVFVTAFQDGTLVKAEVAGGTLAGLALKATRAMSGKFVDYQDDEIKSLVMS